METNLCREAGFPLLWPGQWEQRCLPDRSGDLLTVRGFPRGWCWQMPAMRSWKRQQHQMTGSQRLSVLDVCLIQSLYLATHWLCCPLTTWDSCGLVTALGKAETVSSSPCHDLSPTFSSDSHCDDQGCWMLFRKLGAVIAPSLLSAIRWSVIPGCLVAQGKQYLVVRTSLPVPCFFWGSYRKMPWFPCFCSLCK